MAHTRDDLRTDLALHLVRLGASRAGRTVAHSIANDAQRALVFREHPSLAVAPSLTAATQAPGFYSVERDAVHLCDDAASVARFGDAMGAALADEDSRVGIDAEWPPDFGHGVDNPPALLQIATATRGVWLIDLQRLIHENRAFERVSVDVISALDIALASVLHGDARSLTLGFGFATDLDKLRRGCGDMLPRAFMHVRGLIDLRRPVAGCGRGLARELMRYTGLAVDKRMQCSDWAKRPMSAAMVRYAAADAACLLPLHDAMCAALPSNGAEARAAAELAPKTLHATPLSEPRASRAASSAAGAEGLRAPAARAAAAGADDALDACALAATRAATRATSCGAAVVARADVAAAAPAPREINALCFFVRRRATSEAQTVSHHWPVGADAREEAQRDPTREEKRRCFLATDQTALFSSQYVAPAPARRKQKAREEALLVLALAEDGRIDSRWLANVLGVARSALRLATAAECVEVFGARPFCVPPLPLRRGVSAVLAMDALRAPHSSGAALCGSAGHAEWKLVLRAGAATLPELVRGAAAECAFAWLPSPARALKTLDGAVARFRCVFFYLP